MFYDKRGYCFTCECEHEVPVEVDALIVGPSCTSISKENRERESYPGCYSSGDGSSGYTYSYGVVEAIKCTNPAVLFFENVLGVAEYSTDKKSCKKIDPPVKARVRRLSQYSR